MSARRNLVLENYELRRRLSEAEELLAAIRSGSVDAFATDDQKVFTIKGADHACRILVETMNEGAATLTPGGTVRYCNQRLAKMLKASIEEITGNSLIGFVQPRDHGKFKKLLKQGLSSRGDLTLKKKDGKELIINVSCNPLRVESPLLCMVFTDISKLKATQQKLEKANSALELKVRKQTAELKALNDKLKTKNEELASTNKELTISNEQLRKETYERHEVEKELRRSNEDLEQFASVASHDLREPLRMMSSYSELLERRYKGKLDRDADDFINFIVDGSKRMQALISGLLAYSKIRTTGKVLQELDCRAVLERVMRRLSQEIKESGAMITCDELPTLAGDENDYVRLFQNFIDNAIKFRAEASLRIHISAKKQDTEWLFSVRDNGIGIDPANHGRIFKIFQRLHEREKYPGTGIGLAICRKIVEIQGGRIWIESESGKGATFCFTVPAIKEDEKEYS